MILRTALKNGIKLALFMGCIAAPNLTWGQGGPGGPGGPPVYECETVEPYEGMMGYGWVPKVDGSNNPVYDTLKITIAQPTGSWDPKTGTGGERLVSIKWRDPLNIGSGGTITADPLMYGATEVDLGVNTSGAIEFQYIWDPADDASDTCGWSDPIDPTDPSPPDPPVIPDGPSPPDGDDPRRCDPESAGSSPGSGGIRALPMVRPTGPFNDFSFGGAGGGCSSCGSGGSVPSDNFPLLKVQRTFLPQNQARNSSFGRSVFSNYDMTIQIYPDATDAIVMMDPLTGLVFSGEDSNDDGTYEFEGPEYFGSVTLKNGSGTAVNNPASLSSTNPLYMTVTRRNGWQYGFEFVDAPVYDEEPVTPMGRLVSITSPEGFETTISYKTFTTTQLEESPRRQLQIDTVIDSAGNTAAFTYNSSQQGGLWAVSQISVNSGDHVLAYTYNSNELLMGTTVNGETKATYTYGTDSGWQSATISFDEVQGEKRFKDKLHLSQDYMVWEEQLVNQYADVLLGIEDGAGNDRMVVYRSSTTPGLYRVYDEGRMYEWKRGEYRKYYTTWSQSGAGFSNISGTYESTYDQYTNSSAAEILAGEPQTVVDATGYAVDYTYDSNGNVTRKDYPDSTYEKFLYDANNQQTYHRDRAGYVTTTERDSNNNIVKIGMGLQDTSGSGTPTTTSEAIMQIYGYYGTSHQNEGRLQWEATVAYVSGAVTAPAANERTDYEYNSSQQLVKVIKPLPGGQSSRPEVEYAYTDGRVTTITDEKDEITLIAYNDFGDVIETTFADGTKEQKWINGSTIYTKNRVGVVDAVYYDAAGRLSQTVKAYGHDANLNDLAIDTTHGVNTYTVTNYTYTSEQTQPIYVETNGSRATYSRDYRGRTAWQERYPNSTTSRRTTYNYENNRLFSEVESFGSFYRRQYMGYSADGFTVRSIKTRDPSVTFANNAAVLAATRLTGSDPAHLIVDAVRDVRGNVVQMYDGLGTETRGVFDALGRETQSTRGYGLSYALTTEKEYDSDSNVTSVTDEAGTETVMTYDPAGNLLTKTLAYGTSIAATWTYTYTIDGKQATETMPNTGVNYSYYSSCCGQFVGSKDPLGDGKISNVDALGRVVHNAVVDDYASHTNMYNPIDAKTVGETTTLFGEDGRVAGTTTWNAALGTIDPAAPPIAGLGGVTATNGITTQYVYDNQLGDGVGLDSSGGVTINRLGGGTGSVNIQSALTQLADSVANGGASVSFGSTSRGKATVMIAPDEKSMRVTISDSMGRNVLTALMTGPAATTPNQLENWSAIAYDKTYTLTGVGVCEATWSVDQDGNHTQSIVDGIGKSVADIDQASNLARQKYDSAGQWVYSLDRLSKSTTFEYDLLGRKTKTIDPLSREVTSAYSSTTGRLASVTDAKGHSTSYTYDDLGHVLTETDRTGEVTTKTYDEMGLLATITDAESKTTAYDYDLLGRKDSTTYSDATEMTVDSFDAAGRPLVLTKPSGRQTLNSYNFNGTLAQTQYKNSTGTVTNTETFSYDNYGRKTGSSSSLYNVSFGQSYDDFGRLSTESTTYSGQSSGRTHTFRREFRVFLLGSRCSIRPSFFSWLRFPCRQPA